jgi:peptidoglycan/xylan/chitin deacetylase (PgdA/CDA1 family)
MLFFSDADHIIPPDIIGRHSKKLEQGHSVVVGNIFGRRTLTVIHSGIQKRHKEKILRALQFSDLFETVAAVLACDEHLQLIPNTAPSTVWERVQKFSFTDYWLARWGEIILNFGENLENFNFQWTRISTGSMSLQKKDFLELGGFDTQLQSMEDWELGIRIQQSGMSIVCAPEAEPFHQVHPPNKNRPSDNEKAVTYLTSKHLGIIEALLSEPPYSAPPIQFFFSKSAISEYKDRSLDIMPGTDHPDGNFCLLTFDDGPHPIGTPMVLETLARYDATALFFLIGQQVSSYPSLVKMLVDNGHEIGVHNWSHTDCSMLTSYEVKQKLADTMDRIFDLTGCRVKYARPPYGKFSPSYQEACFELKLTPVGWTSSSEDWAANSARDIIISLARRGIKDKVILFHDVGNNLEETIEGLDWLLRTCKERDIKIATPEEFMKRHCLPSMEICNPFI